MATTDLEVYRRFQGELRPHPLRFWPILVAGLRVAFKRRLPLLLLYVVPFIATVVFSFFVYAKFAVEEEVLPGMFEGGVGMAEILARRATEILEVKNQIVLFNAQMGLFALLAVAWYGAGLFCEDRRAGAHQLYFARPLTRLDYFLGKFLTVAFFGALAMWVPALVICTVASLSSPDWSFLKEQWDVPLRATANSLVWITIVSSLALCASSLASRKSFALVGIFTVFVLSSAFGEVLSEIQGTSFRVFGMGQNMESIADSIFSGWDEAGGPVAPATAWKVMGGFTALCLAVVTLRLRKLEVVA